MGNKTNRFGGIMKDKVLLIPPSKIVAPAPADLLLKDFDFKSEKPKNKRDYTAKEEKDFSMHNISARRTEGTIEQQKALREKTSPALAKLSSSCKAAARRKFDVYPSAYANMWASAQGRKGKC